MQEIFAKNGVCKLFANAVNLVCKRFFVKKPHKGTKSMCGLIGLVDKLGWLILIQSIHDGDGVLHTNFLAALLAWLPVWHEFDNSDGFVLQCLGTSF